MRDQAAIVTWQTSRLYFFNFFIYLLIILLVSVVSFQPFHFSHFVLVVSLVSVVLFSPFCLFWSFHFIVLGLPVSTCHLKNSFVRPFPSDSRIKTDQWWWFGKKSYSCEDFVLLLLFALLFLFSLVFNKSDKNIEEPSSNITSGWLCRLFHTWKLKIFLSDWNTENNQKINSKQIMPYCIKCNIKHKKTFYHQISKFWENIENKLPKYM